jgi:(p)ppGpp synthase/HD superfamily hydrolase
VDLAMTLPSSARPLVRRAHAFAQRAHHGQLRKDGQPFIGHPERVAALLEGLGYADAVVAAALLHDVVEDTPVTLEEVRAAFGDRVAALVAAVTEDPALPPGERKRAYRERVRDASPAARAICAADKVVNLADLRRVAERGNVRALRRFRGGLDEQVRRFGAELRMLEDTDADPSLRDAMRAGLDALREQAHRRRRPPRRLRPGLRAAV